MICPSREGQYRDIWKNWCNVRVVSDQRPVLHKDLFEARYTLVVGGEER